MKRLAHALSILLLVALGASVHAAHAQGGETTGRANSPKEGVKEAAGAPGSIAGRVVDEAGRPIPHVAVMAFPRGMPFNTTPARVNSISTADEEGKFLINNLAPGVYSVNVNVPGYVTARDPGADPFASNAYRVGDFVTVRMTKGGVITGAVSDASGEAVVGVRVRAMLVRELDGSTSRAVGAVREYQTDDRGVYRIYGLAPGLYIVSAGGASQWETNLPSAYEADGPTFFPSGTRDTASEIVVRAGQETNGIDIRYRGESGHTVSGRLEGFAVQSAAEGGAQLVLSHTATGMIAGSQFLSSRDSDGSFAFSGLADGDYEVRARRIARGDGSDDVGQASRPVPVAVRGADVTGLRVALAPLSALKGRLVLAPLAPAERASAACSGGGVALTAREAVVFVRRDEPDEPRNIPRPLVSVRLEAALSAEGDFTLRGLDPGRYRLEARAPAEDWYPRSVTLPIPPPPSSTSKRGAANTRAKASSPGGGDAAATAAREYVTLGAGQTVSGVTLTLAEGAASLRGRVAPPGGESAPALQASQMRVHLVPFVERGRAGGDDDNPLRYAEAQVADDGSFTLTNLAPGRYQILVRPSDVATRTPLAWDAAARARLRREAESAGSPIKLQPCQRIADYSLNFTPPK